MQHSLFTIGHGSRKSEVFIDLLKKHGIQYLVDVRSVPLSRFHPQFNRNTLSSALEASGIRYIFMGDELGGRPKDQSCYNETGKIDYNLLSKKPYYREGIERLKTSVNKGLRTAIMCSERNPAECHRTLLIGATLYSEGISLLHIDEQGSLKDQPQVMQHLNKKKPGKGDPLFDLP
jgi:uncharacterized protein (DUF488 family)